METLMNVQATRLENGARVVTAACPQVQGVVMGVWVNVGGRHEPGRLSGVSHFIEHLLFKGTRRFSARQISQAIEGCGGYLNAFTQEENTCYYARVAAEHAWKTMDVLMDMYRFPRLDRHEIDRERGVIIEEIMMYRDQPAQVVEEVLGQLLWRAHPLGRPLIGTPETVTAMSRAAILAFKESRYVPANTVVVLAGPVKHEECVQRIAEYLRRLPPDRPRPAAGINAGVGQDRVSVMSKDIEQVHLAMGVRLFGREDERRYALKLLDVILGENMSSRLFQIIREKHGLAYSIQSSFHLFADTGALVITAGLDRARIRRALQLIVREVARLKESRVGDRELRRAREYTVGQLRLGLESTTNQMIWAGENYLSYGRFITPEETIRRLSAVTADDIHKLANAIFRPRTVSVAMLMPEKSGVGGDEVAGYLRALQ